MLNSAIHVKATRPYRAKDDLELSLRPGDIIEVIERDNRYGWWTGILHDETGIFPKDCVEIISVTQVMFSVSYLNNYNKWQINILLINI